MANTRIVLNRQSDLMLTGATLSTPYISSPIGLVQDDISGLVKDLEGLQSADLSLETVISEEISTEMSKRAAGDSAEASIRLAADNSLASLLSSEISTENSKMVAGDASLASSINVEKSRIDVILDGSDVNLDQFREVVDYISSIDLDNDENLLAVETSQNTRVSNEEVVRASADASLTVRVSNEEVARLAGDTSLQSAIDAEAIARANADTTLQSNIDNEASIRLAADNSLATVISEEISKEHSHHESAELSLTNLVSVETSNRVSGDASLEAKITNDVSVANASIDTRVSNEEVVRSSADASLATLVSEEISTEKAARESADLSVSAKISTNESKDASVELRISTEEATREEADLSLASSIDNEASIRLAADESLELVISTENSERVVAIDNEASIRLAADNSLAADIVTEEQSRISGDSSLETKIELEATARASADTVLQTSINNEASTRLSADASLTSAIETEKGRIDVILEGSDVNLDQFHEVVTFINSIDVLNDETLVGIETSQNLRVSTEETTRASADASLTTRISNEESTSTSAYASLTTRVSNEESNRVDGDASLETELSTSVSALNSRIEAEMSTEVEARENGDNSLNDMIRVNEQTMNSVDASLAAFISTVESNETKDVASLEESIASLEEADQSLEAYIEEVDDSVNIIIASLETRASIAENIFFTKVTYLGDIDGVNTSFTIEEVVYNSDPLQVYLNGLLQEDGEDYEYNDQVVVFNEAPAATSRVTIYAEIDDNEPSVPEGGGDGDGLSSGPGVGGEEPILVSGIVVSTEVELPGNLLVIGDSVQMVATVSPEDAANKAINWSILAMDGVATIDGRTGLLTATGMGEVTVVATSTDGSDVFGVYTIYTTNGGEG